jgi:hypothetical protein
MIFLQSGELLDASMQTGQDRMMRQAARSCQAEPAAARCPAALFSWCRHQNKLGGYT